MAASRDLFRHMLDLIDDLRPKRLIPCRGGRRKQLPRERCARCPAGGPKQGSHMGATDDRGRFSQDACP